MDKINIYYFIIYFFYYWSLLLLFQKLLYFTKYEIYLFFLKRKKFLKIWVLKNR